jgi:formylglycine-generating enzyme required for sulfatase activity
MIALKWLLLVLFSGFSVSAGGLEIKALDKEQGALVFNTDDSGTAHHNYRIEMTTSLVSAAWSVCSTVGGVGAVASVTNPMTAGSPSMFYRVVATSNSAVFVDGAYMVIDLSGGTNAASYAVTYYDKHSDVPGGVNSDIYKTDKVLLRLIPKGTFTMGARETDFLGSTDYLLHTVTLTKDFYIGVFEVTQRQWELVMGNRPSYFTNATYYAMRPVEQVSYYLIRENPGNFHDLAVEWPKNSAVYASSFMGKLRAKTGLSTLDLPTGSQWEYACRAGTTTSLNSGYNLINMGFDQGMDLLGRYRYNGGLVNGDTDPSSSCTTDNGTAKVGSYLPNAWGLYDMHGNVCEWCLDWSVGMSPGTVTDPLGEPSGLYRIWRSGGCGSQAYFCRPSHSPSYHPDSLDRMAGFRIASSMFDPGIAISNSVVFVDGEYMVVDLSGGAGAVTYTVEYYSGASAVPGGMTNDIYKTDKLIMRKIPNGTFTMGRPATDDLGISDLGLHQVTLTKDFYIGVFEVTQRQWELVMGNRPSYFNNSSYYASRPVEKVSYYDIRENPSNSPISPNWPASSQVDAISFMGKLRAKTGLSTLDLPTESQWEYACRAGITTALNTGYNLAGLYSDPHKDVLGRYRFNGGLVSHNTHPSSSCTTDNGTAKVGCYLPNAWGLYDMHGNVSEWCLDYWYDSYLGTVNDPLGPESGSSRVWRSGRWDLDANSSAKRSYNAPVVRFNSIGFRAVMTLP